LKRERFDQIIAKENGAVFLPYSVYHVYRFIFYNVNRTQK